MAEPTIVPRAQHTISRRDVDPDALKVLYRLHEHNYIAYLVGGSVRDLLLKRRPKDFDIGTSAHPHQVKKLFRNCWIIGRRFRLAHVKFGTKTIEVATFRRHVPASELTPEIEAAVAAAGRDDGATGPAVIDDVSPRRRAEDHLIQRDNTYGTPEEDAFRRDFTVNALFYDIGTFSIIDYVGGLDDLDARIIRCIGDPDVRFLEDPVRMLRAVVLAARLQF
jgi:poly(A) polymerase